MSSIFYSIIILIIIIFIIFCFGFSLLQFNKLLKFINPL